MDVAKNQAEKIHKAIWKAHEKLEQDRQELREVEVARAATMADEALGQVPVDTGLSRKLEALRASVTEQEATLNELCTRHRAALKAQLAEQTERNQKDVAALQQRREEAKIAHAKALGQAMVLQAELEALNAECAGAGGYAPAYEPRFIEGTPEEVLEAAKDNPDFAVDPRSLVTALTSLEDRPRSFGGNAVARVAGKVFIPCLGRVHIAFDPETGEVTKSEVLSTMAIEAHQEEGALVAVAGAVPVKLEEPMQSGPAFNF
jgi:hypothetical protein